MLLIAQSLSDTSIMKCMPLPFQMIFSKDLPENDMNLFDDILYNFTYALS